MLGLTKPLQVVLLLVWAAWIIWKGILPGWEHERSDFSNYYASAKLLVSGESIALFYDNDRFFEAAQKVGVKHGAKFAPFTPYTAYLFVPLTPFSEIAAKRIWLIFNVLLIPFLGVILWRKTKLNTSQLLMLAFIFLTPLTSNIKLGQVYLFITSGLIFSLLFLAEKKGRLLDLIVTAFGLIKIFPFLYLIFKRQSRPYLIHLLWPVCIGMLFSLALIANQGFDPFIAYLQVFGGHLNGALSGQEIHSFNYQSLDGLLHYLFIFEPTHNPSPLFDSPASKSILKWLLVAVVLSSVVWMWIKNKTKAISTKQSLTLIGAALIFPASATYHFLLILYPVSLILINPEIMANRQKKWGLFFICLLTFNLLPHHIPNVASWPSMNAIMHHPRLFGLAGLFLILFVKTPSSNPN